MNEFTKTGVLAGGAVLLAVVAASMGPREVKSDLFSDQGEVFFPKFTDPAAAVDLEITEFNADKADARKFAVHRDKDGRWTIPSHGGYPADAKDRMAKAAAQLIGLRKERCVGESKESEIACGVVDPLDPGTEAKGRGTRITMKDSAGNELADLILGSEVEGKLQVHYLRVPGKRRVYSAKLDGEVSTKFADWIETDLLKAQAYDIDKITFDNYSIDEQRGAIVPGDKFVVSKAGDGKWTFDGVDASKEQPNEERLRDFSTTLGQIKIVDVRSKPEGLTARLERSNGIESQVLAQAMMQKGFFLDRSGKLFSNEGDLLFETKKGVRYTLRFGELVPGDDNAPASTDPTKPAEPAKSTNNRYLMVTAEFVESLLKKPAGARLPQDQLDKRADARRAIEAIQAAITAYKSSHDNKLPESLVVLTEKPAEGEPLLKELAKDPWGADYQLQVQGDTYKIVSFGDDKAAGGEGIAADVASDNFVLEDELKKAGADWADYDKKVKEGEDEAEKLTKRFGPWYYVIDQALFEKLKPKRADLVKPKEAEKPAEGAGNGGVPPLLEPAK